MLVSSYNSLLVAVSFLVAILASYTGLNLAGRVSTSGGKAARWWLTGGACTFGLGIWSMHFIGMLAFHLPIELGYDPAITLLALLVAIGSSAFALWASCRRRLTTRRLCIGALVMGAGVSAMHYLGMEAMMMQPRIVYDPFWLSLSIVIAVIASGTALWITARLRFWDAGWSRKLAAAILMGFAVVGMHYTGMKAAQFPLGSVCGAAALGLDTTLLSGLVTAFTVGVLVIALVVSQLDSHHASNTRDLNKSLSAANRALKHIALHDALTRLPNRALLEDRIDQAMQTAERQQSRFSILFMDLDGFKAINDAYGHAIGDLVLIEMGRRIQNTIRSEDTVARFGGDEFVILSRTSRAEDTATLASKVAHLVTRPFNIRGMELRLSTSIGIAVYPEDGHDAKALLVNADAAMYHRKDVGRNGYSFFDASMNANAEEHIQLVRDLRHAVKHDEFTLHYQPKFQSAHGPIAGVEALVRWQHPTRGLLMPEHFLRTAEKTGQVVELDQWVLNEACRQLKVWRDQGHEWCISVNLSALLFTHADLLNTVSEALERHQLQPSWLTIEVTESTAMRDVETSLEILRKLVLLGVKISLDNFGTGYSNLLYLKRLPANELKIDRSFVKELAANTEDAAIVSAIVAMSKALNLQVVAEGIETWAQQQFLSDLGCDTLQGFLLGRPMPAACLAGSGYGAAPVKILE